MSFRKLGKAISSLDELVYKQYERVTQKVYQEVGWDKYDLTKIALQCGAMSGFCGLSLFTMVALKEEVYGPALFFGLGSGVAMMAYYLADSTMKEYKQREYKQIIQTGMVSKPPSAIQRLVPFGFAIETVLIGSYNLYRQSPAENTFEQLVVGLSFTTAFSCFCLGSYGYFLSQLPQSPKAKKTLSQYVKGSMHLSKK